MSCRSNGRYLPKIPDCMMAVTSRFLAIVALLVHVAPSRAQGPDRDPSSRPLMPAPFVLEPSPAGKLLIAPSPFEPPLGFAGRSRIERRSGDNDEYETVEDRWRLGMPEWDRRGYGHPRVVDESFMLGRWWDPFNLNMLKGDYPIVGQHTFLNITASTTSLFEGRTVPTPTTPFESTAREATNEFFGRPNQFLYLQPLFLSFDLFHGDAGFKPVDWRIRLTPAFNVNNLAVEENSIVNPDPRRGVNRGRSYITLQEWFAEAKLFDVGSEYDFVSARIGSQPFSSDFRGFIFSDTNRGVRLFGNFDGNRNQFNIAYFRQLEKETNSGLNSFDDRNQNIVIANFYRQDFGFPGYTASASVHYSNEGPDFFYDRNHVLVRPDPTGIFTPHRVEVAYLGLAGDGHIGRFNINNAMYLALGRDSKNPLAGQPQDICGKMAALEVSYDRDWARFRVSYLYQSGDGDINNSRATGFDSILDNTNFAGEASFWNRQSVGLFGVNLMQRNSLYNNLRSSKIQGQSNFVNPGLQLVNFGLDMDITPRFRIVNNANYLWFDQTQILEQYIYQANVDRAIGADLSTLIEYRPLLNNNVIVMAGVSTLIPGGGFRQLYNRLNGHVNPLIAGFIEVTLTY